MKPELLRKAVELDLVDQRTARRLINERETARPFLTPTSPPPAERLVLVRSRGRIRRARQQFTKQLLAAGLVDDVVRARKPTPCREEDRMNRQPNPALAEMLQRDADAGIDVFAVERDTPPPAPPTVQFPRPDWHDE